MKVLVNGGLNFSELDGWWAEAYSPDVGWALGDSQEHGNDPTWDAAEADRLYTLLERQVIPAFYRRNETGIPVSWLHRMRESMARLTPQFSATRAVREYTKKHYIPLAASYRRRSSDGNKLARELLNWKRELFKYWSKLRFGSVAVQAARGQHLFDIPVYLDEVDGNAMQVELYADPHALRRLQPEEPLWTFWDYERNPWPLDKGMRLDHCLLSPTVCDRLVDGGVDRWVRGEENASDHAPAWIVLDR